LKEQISDSDFPAESATFFLRIVGVGVCIWAGADGDDGNSNDGDRDDGDGDHGDGDGDGVGDGDYSIRSTLTSRLATSTSALKLPQT
jgi:hypothetical protein